MAKTCLHDGCRSQVFAGGYCKFHQHLTEKSKNRRKVSFGRDKQKQRHRTTEKLREQDSKRRIKKATRRPDDEKLMELVEKCDYLFSKYIRQIAVHERGKVKCYTCGKKGHWMKMQAGHYISRRYYQFRWYEFNVRVQCEECNCVKDGNLVEFSIRLAKEDMKKWEDMMIRKNEVFKITRSYLIELAEDLTKKLIENKFEFNPKI